MAWLPFVFIITGVFIGIVKLPAKFFVWAEYTGNIALIILMLAVGANIGASDTVIKNIGFISVQCLVITFCAVAFSIIFVLALEKTILPLNKIQEKILSLENKPEIKNESDKKSFVFMYILPVCIIIGIIAGAFFAQGFGELIDMIFTASLAVLYISVGIGLARNRQVFAYVKLLGWKIALISAAVILGSLAGGITAGMILNLELYISVLSAVGMSYYSITGAFMTQAYGIDAGTYGFLVNVMREFFAVLLLPLFIRISKGAPVAAGAAAVMDTVLIPVTKFVGKELILVILITGTILTFAVPFLLQILSNFLF